MDDVVVRSYPQSDDDENLKHLGINRKEFNAVGHLAGEIVYHFTGKRHAEAVKEWGWLIPRLATLIRESK